MVLVKRRASNKQDFLEDMQNPYALVSTRGCVEGLNWLSMTSTASRRQEGSNAISSPSSPWIRPASTTDSYTSTLLSVEASPSERTLVSFAFAPVHEVPVSNFETLFECRRELFVSFHSPRVLALCRVCSVASRSSRLH